MPPKIFQPKAGIPREGGPEKTVKQLVDFEPVTLNPQSNVLITWPQVIHILAATVSGLRDKLCFVSKLNGRRVDVQIKYSAYLPTSSSCRSVYSIETQACCVMIHLQDVVGFFAVGKLNQ